MRFWRLCLYTHTRWQCPIIYQPHSTKCEKKNKLLFSLSSVFIAFALYCPALVYTLFCRRNLKKESPFSPLSLSLSPIIRVHCHEHLPAFLCVGSHHDIPPHSYQKPFPSRNHSQPPYARNIVKFNGESFYRIHPHSPKKPAIDSSVTVVARVKIPRTASRSLPKYEPNI